MKNAKKIARTKSEKRLKRALRLCLNSYREPITSSRLLKVSNLKLEVFSKLEQHNAIILQNGAVQLTDTGLDLAKLWFGESSFGLADLNKKPLDELVFGFEFLDHVQMVDNQTVISWCKTVSGDLTDVELEALFIEEGDWQLKKQFEAKFELKAIPASRFTSELKSEIEFDEPQQSTEPIAMLFS